MKIYVNYGRVEDYEYLYVRTLLATQRYIETNGAIYAGGWCYCPRRDSSREIWQNLEDVKGSSCTSAGSRRGSALFRSRRLWVGALSILFFLF